QAGTRGNPDIPAILNVWLALVEHEHAGEPIGVGEVVQVEVKRTPGFGGGATNAAGQDTTELERRNFALLCRYRRAGEVREDKGQQTAGKLTSSGRHRWLGSWSAGIRHRRGTLPGGPGPRP